MAKSGSFDAGFKLYNVAGPVADRSRSRGGDGGSSGIQHTAQVAAGRAADHVDTLAAT